MSYEKETLQGSCLSEKKAKLPLYIGRDEQVGTITPLPYASSSGIILDSPATVGSAGIDLPFTGYELIKKTHYSDVPDVIMYYIDVNFEIPTGYFGMLVPRSNVSKKCIILKNSVGIIDSDYRGTLRAYFEFFDIDKSDDINKLQAEASLGGKMYDPVANHNDDRVYHIGECGMQLILVPYVLPDLRKVSVKELSQTVRGEGGFGSTGLTR